MVFVVFEAGFFMGSKIVKPTGSFAADDMSESSKPEATVMEGVPDAAPAPTPAETVVPEQSGVGTEEKLPVIPFGDVMAPGRVTVDLRTNSPAKSSTPMTPAEEDKDKALSGVGSNDDDVIMERHAKKPRLHRELHMLSENLGRAVESMNETSQAMISMMQQFKQESDELHATAKSLGLQGIFQTKTTWQRWYRFRMNLPT